MILNWNEVNNMDAGESEGGGDVRDNASILIDRGRSRVRRGGGGERERGGGEGEGGGGIHERNGRGEKKRTTSV
jgi:hypothetical protein